jgi:hypothetical protein
MSFRGEDGGFAVEVRPRAPAAVFGDGDGPGAGAAVSLVTVPTAVSGELLRGRNSHPIQGTGRQVRLVGHPDWPRLGALRLLAIDFEDGRALSMLTARPSAAGGHGEEASSALLGDGEADPQAIPRALLSTEYRPSGHHHRAGLELQTAEEAPLVRAAGTEVLGHTIEAGDLRREVSFMEWRMEGRAGTGRYEIAWRGGAGPGSR